MRIDLKHICEASLKNVDFYPTYSLHTCLWTTFFLNKSHLLCSLFSIFYACSSIHFFMSLLAYNLHYVTYWKHLVFNFNVQFSPSILWSQQWSLSKPAAQTWFLMISRDMMSTSFLHLLLLYQLCASINLKSNQSMEAITNLGNIEFIVLNKIFSLWKTALNIFTSKLKVSFLDSFYFCSYCKFKVFRLFLSAFFSCFPIFKLWSWYSCKLCLFEHFKNEWDIRLVY